MCSQLTMKVMTKVFIIKRNNKRYNSKKFSSYEDARKYVRRLVTKLEGTYQDGYTFLGFTIQGK